ncbi:MAG TPA: twin-arginine translocase subunit TatC [Saprospiraceae bacterium]|nr:twin-arginine translocase subunit TatC [Saprospiraceae bacterium]HNM27173.1 twin-arginine translocase subunit TatC [Saprospiraceae bacterium]
MPLDQPQEHERIARGEMSFFEHVAELRKHILRSMAAIAVVATFCFLNKEFVFNTLIFGPRNPDFWTYRMTCWFSQSVGAGDTMCMQPTPFNLITRQLGEVLMQHLYISFWIGLIGAFPYIFWEFWKFISPGLYDAERKAVRGVVVVCSLLFLLGVLFGYFIIAPFSINFLAGYTVEGLEVAPTLDSYVTYMTMFTIPTGLVFEMPVVAYFMAKVGLMGKQFMRTYRRHAIVVILIIAAIITPPDVVSQTLVAIPLYALYEISILVVARVQKKRELQLGLSSSREVEPAD